MKKKRIYCDKKYILIPVLTGDRRERVKIFAEDIQIYEFMIPVPKQEKECKILFYASLPVESYNGRELILIGDLPDVFLDKCQLADHSTDREGGHPHIHFSADSGWLNDPNGFYYQAGEYHLYFQYNPVDLTWGKDMCWGHAVSRDLLHWVQKETVLFPDSEGAAFSGCAICNEHALLGIPRSVPLFFYTCAGGKTEWSSGKSMIQKIAYSLDGGEHFTKSITAVPCITKGNRDPKVYWHAPSKGYYMVLFLQDNEFAILRSENLADWILTQRLSLEGAFECPDLREIPVEGGGRKWVFWSGDGYYFIGDFDGYSFHTEGARKEAYATALPYAAQTCWGTEPIISIPWIRSRNKGASYTGVMGIPRELTLTKAQGKYQIRQRITREIHEHRLELPWQEERDNMFITTWENQSAIEVLTKLCQNEEFFLCLDTVKIHYLWKENQLAVKGCLCSEMEGKWRKAEQTTYIDGCCEKRIHLGKHPEEISVIVDQEIIEITLDDGLVCAFFEMDREECSKPITISTPINEKIKLYRIL